ncbi:unnamed protein product [Linum trigynum]|uniref:Uncharacterized protein n=1 Tax=Linum trigynum TaxID=586398 RepID=A0AAV2CAY2_9ROSI
MNGEVGHGMEGPVGVEVIGALNHGGVRKHNLHCGARVFRRLDRHAYINLLQWSGGKLKIGGKVFPVCSPTLGITKLAGTPEAITRSSFAFFAAERSGSAGLFSDALEWEARVGVWDVAPWLRGEREAP